MKAIEEHDESYSHVLKYAGIFGGVQGLNILLGLVRNKIVALLLGPMGMGLASLFNSVVNFISQATTFGISISAVRHVSELFDTGDEERITHFVKVVRLWSFATALLGMVVCMLAGPILSDSTFSWGNHTLHFVLLAPAIGCMAIMGGENAILKGARKLKPLAIVQLLSMVAALLIALPMYYFFGETGIVPVIVLTAGANLLFTMHYSYRLYPLRLNVSHHLKQMLREGNSMLRLGIAFVIAGVMGSGAEMLIRSFINVHGNLHDVGLYSAGYTLIVAYASMVFSSMEADYFPRLSAVGDHIENMRLTVNRQIEVSVLMATPMLSVLIMALPILMPMLYSSEFLPVVTMSQIAVFSMYLRCVSLPISYLTLARGDSLSYMLLEASYDVVFVLLIILGYTHYGLVGTGAALSLAYVFEIGIVYLYTRLRYGYRFSWAVIGYTAMQLVLGAFVFFAAKQQNAWLHWGLGSIGCIVSIGLSLFVLHKKTSLWNVLKQKVTSRFRHG
jgi:O-antigen/teichoic acid export membrane protein